MKETERNNAIFKDRQSGMTVRCLAEKYNISQTRINQIIAEIKTDISRSDDKLYCLVREVAKDDTIRIYNILRRNNVSTIEQLQILTDIQIKRMKESGVKATEIIIKIREASKSIDLDYANM